MEIAGNFSGGEAALEPALLERAKAYARNARAASTQRAYASDLADFECYCARSGFNALPAEPPTIALYLTDLAGRLEVSTMKRRIIAISQHHRLYGPAPPSADPIVREIVRGIERTHGTAPHKKWR